MPNAEQLLRRSMGGLEQLAADPAKTEQYLYQNALDAIDKQARGRREDVFARGMGLSTIREQMENEVRDAKLKAQRDAYLSAQQASLAALGQAAGAAGNQLNREQQAAQYAGNQQMQKDALNRQESTANRQMLTQGLGGLGMAGVYGLARGGAFKGVGGALAGAGKRGLDRLWAKPSSTEASAYPGETMGEVPGVAGTPYGGIEDYGSADDLDLGGIDFGIDDLGGLDALSFDPGDADFLLDLFGPEDALDWSRFFI